MAGNPRLLAGQLDPLKRTKPQEIVDQVVISERRSIAYKDASLIEDFWSAFLKQIGYFRNLKLCSI
jgi:hypothetical protein